VLRDPVASVRNSRLCVPASPEALFDSLHLLKIATAETYSRFGRLFVRVRGIETYSFSTPIGWIVSQAHNPVQSGFDSSRNMPPACFFTPHSTNKIAAPDGAAILLNCAGERNRTPDYCLEGSRFTTKLHPRSERVRWRGVKVK